MKLITKICTLMAIVVSLIVFGTTANAAGSVTYVGDADEFIFAPGSSYSPTDLYSEFKGVMPGDTLAEHILIRNDRSKDVKIKVYLRSHGAQEDTDDFLSQMNLVVMQDDNSLLFAAPADETAQLTDWVYLGTVYSGGEIELDLMLQVPITMDNAYQNQIGYIDWEFMVEKLPVESSDPKPPKTGDTNDILLYAGLLIISAVVLIMILAGRRKKHDKNES